MLRYREAKALATSEMSEFGFSIIHIELQPVNFLVSFHASQQKKIGYFREEIQILFYFPFRLELTVFKSSAYIRQA